MSLRLMLVRHGETPSNVLHLLDSRPPGPSLTELGRQQAAALAERLTDEPVLAVYASTATRAQETAEPVAKSHGHTVRVVEGLHELQCGDLEGRGDQEAILAFGQVYLSWVAGDLDTLMPGGETGAFIRTRYLAAVDDIAARHRHEDGLVVAVSHGGVIRLAAEWLADNVTPELAGTHLLANTGHVLLEARDEGWHCLEWTGVEV
ncbi:putative phosphoglycerate mutase [Actinokineospora spheciospongiae]|uniref:Putative phosphoglycerate mutase n=1 Tax=Actinokineospora spheciospongiae TaxID=909613 RepID=W7J1G9_9PSEU|nr:histidine phosphatase family protein [Actinokineospora spheciospongiae]EWC62887.1 putative phosphoglycerate mutase [Actinokineospora spheciospongiae]